LVPVVKNQLTNTKDVIVAGGNVLKDTGNKTLDTIVPAIVTSGKGALNLVDSSISKIIL
jgi:hypothetical protein